MSITIAPKNDYDEVVGQRYREKDAIERQSRNSMHEGIGQGIQALLDSQVQKRLQKQQYNHQLNVARGLNYPNADQIAHAQPDVFKQLIKEGVPNQAIDQYAQGGQQLLPEYGNAAPQEQEQESDRFGTMLSNPKIQKKFKKYLESPEALKEHGPEAIEKVKQKFASMGYGKDKLIPIDQEKKQQLPKNPIEDKEYLKAKAAARNDKEREKVDAIFAAKNNGLTPKELAAEKKEAHKEELAAHKDTYKYYKELKEEEKASKELKRDTDRMLKLIDKGNLPNGAVYKILKNLEEITPSTGATAGGAVGAGIGAATGGITAIPAIAGGAAIGGAVGAIVQPLATLFRYAEKKTYPDTEEFEKLSASMIKGAKAIFGARITDNDLRAFMDTIPTLAQTDTGKKAIIRNMGIIAEAGEVRARHARHIMKENGGLRPFDFEELVDERSARELDKLSERFVEGS